VQLHLNAHIHGRMCDEIAPNLRAMQMEWDMICRAVGMFRIEVERPRRVKVSVARQEPMAARLNDIWATNPMEGMKLVV
jgi:hypothetical protein